MFIARTTNQRGHKWCGLVESDWYPQLKKSRKRNIATLTHVPPPVVAAIDAALR